MGKFGTLAILRVIQCCIAMEGCASDLFGTQAQ